MEEEKVVEFYSWETSYSFRKRKEIFKVTTCFIAS